MGQEELRFMKNAKNKKIEGTLEKINVKGQNGLEINRSAA